MKVKKLLSLLAACAMAVTALLGAMPITASADDEILPDSGAWSTTSVSSNSQLSIMNYPSNKLISALDGQNDIYVTFTVSGVTTACAAYLAIYTTAGTKLSVWEPSDVSTNTAGVTNTLTEITADGTYTVSLHSDTAFTADTAYSFLAVCFTTGLGSKTAYKISDASLDSVTLTDPNAGSGSAIIATYTSGDTTCTLYDDGSFVVSGTGAMADFKSSTVPWSANASLITSVLIESGVTSIGAYSFYNCTNLTDVEFSSNSLEAVGDSVFNKCTALETVNFPSSVTKLGESMFSGCTALKSFSVPINVTELPYRLFYKCSALSTLVMPDNITSMSNYVFLGCTSLTTITLPKALETVTERTFNDSGFTAINANSESTAFSSENGVLYNADKTELIAYPTKKTDTSFTVPTTVEKIWSNAFYNNTALETVTMTAVTNIGEYVFSGCTALKSAPLPEGLTEIPNSAFNGCALTSVTIPSGITKIGNYAFSNCSALESVSVPNTVTSLGTSVFYNDSSLKEAVISSGITTIPAKAFSGCTNAELKIFLLGTITSHTASSSFGNAAASYVTGTIYVYNETSYTTLSTSNAVTNGYATLAYAADFTELKALIEEVNNMKLSNYTDASVSVVKSSLSLAESVVADYAASQEQADEAYNSLKAAVDGLVLEDSTEAWAALNKAISATEDLLESDYNAIAYATLEAAVDAAKSLADDAMPGDIKEATNAINEALSNLRPAYAYADTLGYMYYYNTGGTLTILSGNTTDAMAGATKVKIYFDCASDVSYNIYTTINLTATIADNENSAEFTGTDSSYTTGSTGWSETLSLSSAVESGKAYSITGYTWSWSNASDYVFAIKRVEFLNDDGDVLFSTKDIVVPNEDLIAAVEEAKAVDTTGWTDDEIANLEDAIEAAEAVLAEDIPLPSELESAEDALTKSIATAVERITAADTLAKAISDAEAINSDNYTEESVAALAEALEAAKALTDEATVDEINAAAEAINEAIAGLTVKPSELSSEPTSNTTASTSATTAKTTAKTTVDSKSAQAAKDKAAAQKLMKQAKITKLSVKSKAKKKITVSWKKVKKAKGYQIQVSTKKNFKKIILKKFTSKKRITLKSSKIKSKKTYYVRVRAYATYKDKNGTAKKVYSAWNKKLRKVKVK